MKKRHVLFAAVIMMSSMLIGCGDEYEGGIRVGATITPAPTATPEAEYNLDMTDDEIKEVLKGVAERAAKISKTYDFYVTDEMTVEKSVHDDDSSEIFVYDQNDNLIAVLIYEEYTLIQANLDNYLENAQVSGCVYKNSILSSYYETAELNGYFRVEVVFGTDSEPEYIVTTGKNSTKKFVLTTEE